MIQAKTKGEILDKYYQSGMHWKTINRGFVMEAMDEYATQQNKELREALQKIKVACDNDSTYFDIRTIASEALNTK